MGRVGGWCGGEVKTLGQGALLEGNAILRRSSVENQVLPDVPQVAQVVPPVVEE